MFFGSAFSNYDFMLVGIYVEFRVSINVLLN